jgi:arylsulfatase A-like enzyme
MSGKFQNPLFWFGAPWLHTAGSSLTNMLLYLLVALGLSGVNASRGGNTTKPNIWLIISDDLGFGDLGYTGHSSIATPSIDAMATEGVILGHYYVMQCCSPTRSAIMTGRYNIRYGLQTQVIPNNKRYGLNLDEKTIPEYLNPHGYTSHAIGKWHLGIWNWGYTPTYRGFDSFFGYYGGGEDYFTHSQDFRLDIGKNCGPNCSQTQPQLAGNYSTELYAQRQIEIIQNHDFAGGTAPLFLYSAFQAVHCPYESPDSYEQFRNKISGLNVG